VLTCGLDRHLRLFNYKTYEDMPQMYTKTKLNVLYTLEFEEDSPVEEDESDGMLDEEDEMLEDEDEEGEEEDDFGEDEGDFGEVEDNE
jgi:hypothetical protein